MSPKIGCTKVKNPQSNRITVRMDDETLNILTDYCEKEKIDKAEAIRRGILNLGK